MKEPLPQVTISFSVANERTQSKSKNRERLLVEELEIFQMTSKYDFPHKNLSLSCCNFDNVKLSTQ